MAALKVGVEALQKALPQIPMGSKLHQAVLKAVGEIGKHMEEEGSGAGGDQIQQLLEMVRNAKQNPGMAGMMPPPGGSLGGGAGGPPPPMPPMGG